MEHRNGFRCSFCKDLIYLRSAMHNDLSKIWDVLKSHYLYPVLTPLWKSYLVSLFGRIGFFATRKTLNLSNSSIPHFKVELAKKLANNWQTGSYRVPHRITDKPATDHNKVETTITFIPLVPKVYCISQVEIPNLMLALYPEDGMSVLYTQLLAYLDSQLQNADSKKDHILLNL